MKHSDSIAKLAPALVSAQRDLKAVGKDGTNPHFKNRYATLDAIIEAVRPVLAANRLAIAQGATTPVTDDSGALVGFAVETMLIHESGEWLTNTAILPLVQATPQGAGAALTYGRRYAISALLSLATEEDDDGSQASPRPQTAAASRSHSSSTSSTSNGSANAKNVPVTERIMPFGKTKGKKLVEHTTEQLSSTVAWCREKDAAKFAGLIEDIGSILAGRALESETLEPLPF